MSERVQRLRAKGFLLAIGPAEDVRALRRDVGGLLVTLDDGRLLLVCHRPGGRVTSRAPAVERLGDLAEVVYVRGPERQRYRHKFPAGSQPVLVASDDHLVVRGGVYHVTRAAGIVDGPRS